MRAAKLSLKSHHHAPFSFKWENDPVWTTKVHIQVKLELLSQTRTLQILLAFFKIENTPKLLSTTQNENTKLWESRFRFKTQMLRKIGKNLSARDGYELWPRQPLRNARGTMNFLSSLCPATPTRSKCRLQAPHGNEAVDGCCGTQPVGWYKTS